MKQIHELLGYKNIKIIQDDEMFSFSVDSMLLADFIKYAAERGFGGVLCDYAGCLVRGCECICKPID